MAASRHLFSSESVTMGHPDKVADQISDAVLDAIMAQDPLGRVACETLVTTGLAMVAGEITTTCYVHIPDIVRNIIREGKTQQLQTSIESGAQLGMQTMDKCLAELFRKGRISRETALHSARKPEEVERQMLTKT